MKADVELISTGAELLSGRTINQHAHTLGAALAPCGYYLSRDTTLPDDIDAIAEAIRSAMERVDIVFVSGGLGPTSDDITRDALAAITGAPIVTHEETLAVIRTRYEQRGRSLSKQGERQALVLEGADVLSNEVGAAPGERIQVGAKTIFVLPGPPSEFRAVLEDHVLPWLRDHAGLQAIRYERVMMTSGIGESDILALFEAADFPGEDIAVAYRAGAGRVEICFTSKSQDPKSVDQAADQAQALLGEHIYANERIDMEDALGRKLLSLEHTLAVAESCTGGLLGSRLTSVSGSSAYFLGGVMTYSNEAKARQLNVDARLLEREGAVSEAVACAMAEGVRASFGADYGVSITGIAGPGGGTEEKPVGTVCVAIASAQGTSAHTHRFRGDREAIRDRSARAAMDMLWRQLESIAS